MRIGVPKEIKVQEYRVGLTPASVLELTHRGHEVVANRLAEVEMAPVPSTVDQSPGRGLLIGRGDAALEQRPARPVARVEGVEDLSDEVGEAPLVEGDRV